MGLSFEIHSILPLFLIFILSSFIALKFNSKTHEEIDRLFFHDLINQTHGVTLFLNYKVGINEPINIEETKNILNEIKILQTLIKDHFHLNHKNLHNLHEVVSFHRIKNDVLVLINNFLPEFNFHTNVVFKRHLLNINYPCLIRSSVFFRVFTNLIKNISEENSKYVEFEFSYDDLGLSFVIKNKILNLNDDYKNILNNLQKIILFDNQERNEVSELQNKNSLGLKSVFFLCEKEGGKCNFSLDNDFWVTEIFLPNPIGKIENNRVKKSA